MNLELIGRLKEKSEIVNVSEKFSKREFVVELTDEINGVTYSNYAVMQLINNKCGIIDQFNVGDMIKVSFNIKGKAWQDPKQNNKTRYFSNLDAWRVEPANGAATSGSGQQQQQSGSYNNNYNNQPAAGNYSGPAQTNHPSHESADDLPF